jgi:hypothetical protein
MLSSAADGWARDYNSSPRVYIPSAHHYWVNPHIGDRFALSADRDPRLPAVVTFSGWILSWDQLPARAAIGDFYRVPGEEHVYVWCGYGYSTGWIDP